MEPLKCYVHLERHQHLSALLATVDMEAETEKEFELRLLSSLDTLKVKDKKDQGTLTIKVLYHQFDKKEQLAALEAEKRTLEGRKKLKEEGVIGSTMDALDRAASVVGFGFGLVGSGAGAGAGGNWNWCWSWDCW